MSVAVIARLKSQRLPKKVLAEIGSESLIEALYNNISKAKLPSKIRIATSDLPVDDELADHCSGKGLPVFRGHPVSVADRMLDMAWDLKSGIILRVTGDNPFTAPELMDEMLDLIQSNELDYVKANNVPFGMSAEVFTTRYLWKLYIGMENPMQSEYLTWFVLNDNAARKGCIDVEYPHGDLSFRNLSIDYPQDLKDARSVLECTGVDRISNAGLPLILSCCSKILRDKKDEWMKLPDGSKMRTSDYINKWKNTDYKIRKTVKVDF